MMKRLIAYLLKKNILPGYWYRNYKLSTSQPSWDPIFKKSPGLWNPKTNAKNNGPKILLATSVGAHLPGTTVESLLGVALTLRGADVHVLLCDSVLPACLNCTLKVTISEKTLVKDGPQKKLCHACFHYADKMFQSLHFKAHYYSELLNPQEIQTAGRIASETDFQEIKNYKLDGLAVGEHALAGVLRFYAKGTLDDELYAQEVLRRYFKAALLTVYATRTLLKRHHFDGAVFHTGIYVPQGSIGEVCRQENVKVVNWEPAYKSNCFVFTHHYSQNRILAQEPTTSWENLTWTPEMETQLMDYLKSRWYGGRDWISYQKNSEADVNAIANAIGVDFSKPCIGLLTNVFWDAQLFYPSNAFSNMMEWVLETIEYFRNRPDLQLLIRVHPGEVRTSHVSRQPVAESIKKHFPDLPKNVFVAAPDSPISTYAAMSQCNAVIIYGTTTGIEIASMGIPVIVVGESWLRNKKIAFDVSSKEEYYSLLNRLPFKPVLDDERLIRARKYAYHLYFRRMIPVEFTRPHVGNPPYKIRLSSLSDLLPGKDKGLDIICDGILQGSEFIFPAEKLSSSEALHGHR